NVSNRAVIPAWLTVAAQNLVLSAEVAIDGADHTATVTAASTAGAAGGVGVAGSVAIVIVDQDAVAAVYGTVALTGGDLTATAASDLAVTVTALPAEDGVSGESIGIGVAFALGLVTDDVHALLADGVAVTGAHDVTLAATALTVAAAAARMGASATGSAGGGTGGGTGGGSGGSGGVALTPAIAIIVSNITTDARVGTAASGLFELSGSLVLAAMQDATAGTTAG